MEEKLSVHKQTNKDPKLQFEVVVSQEQEMLLQLDFGMDGMKKHTESTKDLYLSQ